MRWEVTTPQTRPISFDTVKTHLRLNDESEKSYVETVIDDAVNYAESEIQGSLGAQTITATYYEEDVARSGDKLWLPRGPVNSVTSVTANGVLQSTDNYELKRVGNWDYLDFSAGANDPVVVVYTAGYSTIPAALRRALLLHIGTLYENRESMTRPISYELENGLKRVYEMFRREPMVG
jgi:uncharacterized phiE125 gp8 family phage protein